jgi:flagellar basal-body rod protein FlgB
VGRAFSRQPASKQARSLQKTGAAPESGCRLTARPTRTSVRFASARSYSYFLPAGHAVAPLQTNMLEALTGNLEKYLDLLTARQKLVASNIANADTPGYLTKDIDFQREFMSMVNGQQPLTVNAPGLPLKPDGNNVSVDREARMLAENAMRFNVASVLLRGQINTVKEAITGGSSS